MSGFGSLARKYVIGLALIAALIPIAAYAHDQYAIVLAVILQEAIYQLIYLLPCFLLGRLILRRGLGLPANTVPAVVSAVALGLGAIGFATLALGLLGALSTVSAWVVLAGAAAAGLLDWTDLARSLEGAQAELGKWLKQPSAGGWLWIVAAVLFAIPLVGATLMPGTLWRPDDPHPYDSLVYHLQAPREWFELGRIVPLKHNVYSFFPFNVEMHYLLADYLRQSPWRAMHQNQFLSVSLTILLATAMWAYARQRYGRLAGPLAAVSVISLPWVLMLACVTYVEIAMLLFAALALIWFMEAMRQEVSPVRCGLAAGIFCGLACGTKLTNVPMLMFALPASAVFMCFGRKESTEATTTSGSLRRWLLVGTVFAAGSLAVLSPWLIRNQVWAGNPLFPLAMRQLGQAHFTDTQVERFERAHRAAEKDAPWPARTKRLATQVLANWRYNYVLFPLALLGLALNARRREAWSMFFMALLIAVFWLTMTHLMGRFFVLAAIPLALLVAMLPPKWNVMAGVLICAFAINSWIGVNVVFGREPSSLNDMLSEHAARGREGLFGLQDYSLLSPPELEDRVNEAKTVVLVGDAQVFYRKWPMSKIRYSTVFDLNAEGGRDIFDAYYGPPPARCPWDVLVLIDEAEARRLSQTYWKVPALTTPAPERFRETVRVTP